MVNKLEDKIYSEQHQQPPVIDFEKNELLTGINGLMFYIKRSFPNHRSTSYQSFKARPASEIIFFPLSFKRIRNRWFVLGMTKKERKYRLALDRIQDLTVKTGILFAHNKSFDAASYFKDIVGVTRNTGDKPAEVIFFANHIHAPYIRTKPIHSSQKVIEEKNGGIVSVLMLFPILNSKGNSWALVKVLKYFRRITW